MEITGNLCPAKRSFKNGIKQRHFKTNKSGESKTSRHSPKEILKDELQREGRADTQEEMKRHKNGKHMGKSKWTLYKTIIIMSDEIKSRELK